MGKYNELLKNMPKKFGDEDPSHREKLNAVKDQIRKDLAKAHDEGEPPYIKFTDIAEEVKRAEEEYEEAERALKTANLMIDAYTEVLAEMFEKAGIDKCKVPSGGSISLHSTPYAQIKDVEKTYAWAKKQGIKFAPAWSAINSRVASALEEGMPLPPGVEVFRKDRIQYYKKRGD